MKIEYKHPPVWSADKVFFDIGNLTMYPIISGGKVLIRKMNLNNTSSVCDIESVFAKLRGHYSHPKNILELKKFIERNRGRDRGFIRGVAQRQRQVGDMVFHDEVNDMSDNVAVEEGPRPTTEEDRNNDTDLSVRGAFEPANDSIAEQVAEAIGEEATGGENRITLMSTPTCSSGTFENFLGIPVVQSDANTPMDTCNGDRIDINVGIRR